MSSSLFRIPSDLLNAILAFTVLKDVCRLLSAVCNYECRDILLRTLDMTQGEAVTFPGIGFKADSRDCWDWLAKHGIALRELILSVESVTDRIPYGQFRYLVDLTIGAKAVITNELLHNFISNCPNLKHLRMPFDYHILCHSATAALGGIGTALPALQTLDLTGIGGLSDAALASIGTGCPLIESMKERGHANLTDAGLSHLMMHKSYRTLHLEGFCRNVTSNGWCSRPLIAWVFSRGARSFSSSNNLR
jgi:hypothetical protein